MFDYDPGFEMHNWCKELFPLNRSLTGDGTLDTLKYFKKLLTDFEIKSFTSGEAVFDWTIPKVWNVKSAHIQDRDGNKLIDFKNSNLHLVGYSTSVDQILSKSELLKHIYFIESKPLAIPYVTSYYKENWGFCLSKLQWESIGPGPFRVLIDSSLEDGKLNYGEIFIPGKSRQEILLSTYICHPSLANDNLSGPVVLTKLLQQILKIPERHYSYRAVFLPETIGSLAFLSRNLEHLKNSVVAGWVLTCLGDEGQFSYIPSRSGLTYADKVTLKLLETRNVDFQRYSWLDRGSDERQYCWPGIDLPVCSITKSKYGEFPEYHNSLDNLEFVTPLGLSQSLNFYSEIVRILEENRTPRAATQGEPQLSRRGLYPTTSNLHVPAVPQPEQLASSRDIINILSYLDGQHNLSEISTKCNLNPLLVESVVNNLEALGLVKS